jgi:precorrin-4 methylase
LAEADVVIWGAAMLAEEVVSDYARPEAELVPWPPATMSDIYTVYERANRDHLVVARLFWGDPAIFGAVRDEAQEAERRGLAFEVVPGVSALGASAAALGLELTTAPGASPPLILAAWHEDAPAGQGVHDLARHGATMALFMAGKRGEELQSELLAGGFGPATPCAVAHRISWPDELVLRCRLDRLASTLARPELERQTLVLVGPALAPGLSDG